ncbi:hypothetical protein CRYUN_Cryun04dG0068800 [Craigia yunnanensis]
MTEFCKILPEIDHYACMIDLYGRANQLEKAVAFMKVIPIEHDAAIMGAFLNACRLNKSAELAREAEEKLLRIEGDNGAHYVQLANIYAAEGNWAEMRRIRKEMRGKVKKFAGCSWIIWSQKSLVRSGFSCPFSAIDIQECMCGEKTAIFVLRSSMVETSITEEVILRSIGFQCPILEGCRRPQRRLMLQLLPAMAYPYNAA